MMTLKQHYISSLIYLLITAVLGFFLRLEATPFSLDIPSSYRFIVHTHSHVALLGWVYLALSSCIVYFFVEQSKIKKYYLKIFWTTQACIIGMLIFFPLQGYALFSIIFSTLFLIVSYVFFGFILKHSNPKLTSRKSFLLIKHALFYMVLSSIGPWALGGIMSTLGNQSVWYKLVIYFYLHFQYNAWFILAAFGLLIFLLEQSKVTIESKSFSIFLSLYHIGIIGTFFLSCLWASSHWSLYALSNLGSLCLWVGLFYLWKSIQKPFMVFYSSLNQQSNFILKFLAFVFILKMMMQTLTGIPYFAELATANLDLVIGYFHWFFLGFVTLFLLFLASYLKWIKLSKLSLSLYLFAFILTEFLIFYRAGIVIFKWSYFANLNLYLALFSFLFCLSIINILISTLMFNMAKFKILKK
ncbi:hypothetical protein LB452_06025 [Psychroflexus sp. CAK8W]|uniref:Cytochrome C and Quinol oxidase polypeptide I n=1 Tax=Psychroflexus longus TaxID=2873596 RepID=A0ABS7XHP5_9FLAO|nr:hypothetical protein [Psychroflexus longus]MBZ9778477.1 hypothetical protein [Psychroflexus longus]